jgi:hypothetical protein
MILDFTEELDEMMQILHLQGDAVSSKQSMELMGVCVRLLDRGMAAERSRVIQLVQKHAMNPGPLVERIRKPLR